MTCIRSPVRIVTTVGQTKRQLKTRMQEHSADIRKKNGPPYVISNHHINDNHDFNWTDIEILDHERNYNKRLIFEMVHIIKQRHDLNKVIRNSYQRHITLSLTYRFPLRVILSYFCTPFFPETIIFHSLFPYL